MYVYLCQEIYCVDSAVGWSAWSGCGCHGDRHRVRNRTRPDPCRHGSDQWQAMSLEYIGRDLGDYGFGRCCIKDKKRVSHIMFFI